MSNDADSNAETPDSELPPDARPEELPPVEPPSAGFIVQLFVIPGVIVMAVVAVWALFGKLSSSEQDWRTLLVELRSTNEHRRWRGAEGLAQLLQVNQNVDSQEEPLAQNPYVAEQLAELFHEQLQRTSPNPSDLAHQQFLAKTLGWIDVPEVVIPVLLEGMGPAQDREVRKNSIASIAAVTERAAQRNAPIEDPEVVQDLIAASTESDPLIRQMGAFVLGLFSTEEANQQLQVLLEDGDSAVRLNAAIGLTRQQSTEGIEVFKETLVRASNSATSTQTPNSANAAEIAAQQFEQSIALQNTFRAIEQLADVFSTEQRDDLLALAKPLAKNYQDDKVRIAALSAVAQLEAQE